MAEHDILSAFNRCVALGDVVGAEPLAAILAAQHPGSVAVLEAALACNRSLGRTDRATCFARQLLAMDEAHFGAHLALLDGRVLEGDPGAELASRTHLALAPTGTLHPLRRLHEAHRAISLHLLRPHAAPPALAALVAAARGVDPDALPEGEARHWARHYRHLCEAADPAFLSCVPPKQTPGRQTTEARLAFVVAADTAYVRLYGRAFLTSILRECDVPALIVLHVIGGAATLPDILRMLGLPDPRIRFSADDFSADAVTTPRARSSAVSTAIRFAAPRHL